MEERPFCRFCGTSSTGQILAEECGNFCCEKRAEVARKEEIFKEEVKRGLHPEWTVDKWDSLQFIGKEGKEGDEEET